MNANATARDQPGIGPHVLVVDDDPEIGSLLERYLTGSAALLPRLPAKRVRWDCPCGSRVMREELLKRELQGARL